MSAPTDTSILSDRRGYVTLTLWNGDIREISGFGVQVQCVGDLATAGIEATANGLNNQASRLGRLYFGLNDDQPSPGRAFDPYLQTVPGARRLVVFDRLKYVTPDYPLGANPITIRVLTIPRTAWIECDPAGKPRVRYLARSAGVGLALTGNPSAGDTATLFGETASGQLEDRFWTDEEFDEKQFWTGLIFGTASFEVYVVSKQTAFAATRMYVQKFTAKDYTGANVNARMLVNQPAVVQGFVVDLCQGVNPATNTNSTTARQPVPGGLLEMYVVNLAAGANTIHYHVGVVGHQ